MSLVVLAVASIIAGNRLLRALHVRGVESVVFGLLTGLSVCAALILGTGSISLNEARLLMNILALSGLGYHLHRHAVAREGAAPRTRFDAVEWMCLGAGGTACALALLGALAPATSWDACVAHLALPKEYSREGRILFVPGNEYTAYPHLLHVLYTYVFSQNGEWGAMLLSWAMGVAACGSAYVLGARLESRRCGLLAAAMLATAPIFLDQAGSVGIDLAFCAFAVAALAALAAWFQEWRLGWLALSGWLAGSACGIRHTGYLVCVLLALGALWAGWRQWRTLPVLASMALLGASPWLLRSAILTGNPFYPLLADWFGVGPLPHWPVGFMMPHPSLNGFGWRKLLMFPWDITMRPYLFDGWSKSPGGLLVLLGLPGLVVGGKRARALGLYSLAGIMFFFFFERYARYVLPFFVPMMVVAGMAACRLKTLRWLVGILLAAGFAFGLALDLAAVHFKIPVVLGVTDRATYLADRVERYPAFDWVNRHIPLNDTIFTFDRRTYFFDGRTYQNDEPLRPLLEKPIEEQTAWMAAQGIRWIFLPVTFIDESPAYRDSYRPLAAAWRGDKRSFVLVKQIEMPNPRTHALECVEVYYLKRP